MTGQPTPKPWIAAIHAYVPGKSRSADGRELIKLSANENPLGTSPAALAARAQAVMPSLYPDPDSTALREALGQLHGIDPARIICGTGSGELLAISTDLVISILHRSRGRDTNRPYAAGGEATWRRDGRTR